MNKNIKRTQDILKIVWINNITITKEDAAFLEENSDKKSLLEKALDIVGLWNKWNAQKAPYQIKVLGIKNFLIEHINDI